MADLTNIFQAASCLQDALKNNNLDSLSAKDFRVFIDFTQKHEILPEVFKQVSENLLAILSSGNLCNDSLIVVAMAYSNIIASLQRDSDAIFQHFVNLLQANKGKEHTIYLCHAILQLQSKWTNKSESREALVQEIFHVVKLLCGELKSTTFLGFKVFYNLLCKIHQLYPSGNGVCEQVFIAMLDIVMSNWENPLTGVRQQNSLILCQLLLFTRDVWIATVPVSDEGDTQVTIPHYPLIKMILTHLSWSMKAKYFLLTAVLQKSDVPQVLSVHGPELVSGLVLSLSIPHLVSAGSDLYRAVLSSLSVSQWQCHFLAAFTDILTRSCVCLEVENLFSYWLQPTIKKSSNILKELVNINTNSLYYYVALHRIGRKEGFPCSDWERIDKDKLHCALVDGSEKIRTQAFALVCTSSKTMVFPLDEEFRIVQDFLRQNVNSDNTPLRQSLLNLFTNFIIRIRDSLLGVIKSKQFCLATKSKTFAFLDWIHSFILCNLKVKCNYQRKITSLELYKIVLTYLGDPPKSEGRSYTRKTNKNHLNLKEECHKFSWVCNFESISSQKVLLNCLFDEDNEILSSSANILMKNYKSSHSDLNELTKLFKTGLKLSTDQTFYKAESGALITQVCVTLATKSSSKKLKEVIYNGNPSFLSRLLSSAEEQLRALQEDLLRAASQGSFLYGTLQAITLLLTESSSPEYMLLDETRLERLLRLLEVASSYFIAVLSSKSDPESDFAPSFGEMGMAVADVVERSSLQDSEVTVPQADDPSYDLQLTPAQQLVLNCIWLNLKECCKLSSRLVNKLSNHSDTMRCVSLVTTVLRKCRHKGAIESAGLALAHITNHLTSSSDPLLVALPRRLLEDFLQSIVGSPPGTVSRRSAGLAILVHRLITGDARPSKPLLHDCVNTLLPIATSPVIADDKLTDLPQSQALHFLRSLMQEAALRQLMAQYTLPISLVALSSLACPDWTIRNAALQLFGALVPKLVGQKPHQEEGKGTHHLAFEELLAHAEPLVGMMLSEFSAAGRSNSMILHSNLMPLLTLVTNLTVGLQTVLKEDVAKLVHQFQDHFQLLFKSNIFNVRKLSAKAHALFFTCPQIVSKIEERVGQISSFLKGEENCIRSENELHGYLLNVYFLLERFEEEKIGVNVLLMQQESVYKMINVLSQAVLTEKCSHFVKSLVFEMKFPICCSYGPTKHSSSSETIGFPLFISRQLNSMLTHVDEKTMQNTVYYWLMKSSNYDVQLGCLKSLKTIVKENLARENFFKQWKHEELFNLLKVFSLQNIQNSELFAITLEIMLHLLENFSFSSLQSNEQYCCADFLAKGLELLFSDETPVLILVYLLPVVCGIVSTQENVDLVCLSQVTDLIKARSDPGFDQDVRIHAAKSMTLLLPLIKNEKFKESKCGASIWEACVDFLQDEVTEVRLEASRFVTNFLNKNITSVWNPFHALECMFKLNVVSQLMLPEEVLDCILKRIMYKTQKVNSADHISNPFDHGVKSIYAEEGIVLSLAYDCILESTNASHYKQSNNCITKLKELCNDNKNSESVSPETLHCIRGIVNHLDGQLSMQD